MLRDCDISELEKDNGFETLLTYLEEHLAKDAMLQAWGHYRENEDYKRGEETVLQYVNNFDHKCKQVETSGDFTIPPFL